MTGEVKMTEWNRIHIDCFPCGFCRIERSGDWKLLQVNHRLHSMLGHEQTPEKKENLSLASFFSSSDWPRIKECLNSWSGQSFSMQEKVSAAGNQLMDFRFYFSGDDDFDHVMNCVVFDVTDQVQEIEQLKIKNREQKLLLGHKKSLLCLEYSLSREAQPSSYSRMIEDMAKQIYFSDRRNYLSFFDRERLLMRFERGEREDTTEYRMLSPEHKFIWVKAQVQLILDHHSEDIKVFITVKDIDEAKRREILLQERSVRDSLTGTLNRGAVIEQISRTLEESEEAVSHALIMVDLDHFKQINDQIGHCFGDQVLAGVAKNIKNSLRKGDLIGRLGGDEFAIFLKDMPTGEALQNKLDYLCDKLYLECGSQQHVSGSMGVAVFPRDAKTFEDLYHKADLALYEAKGKGRNQYVFYDPKFYREPPKGK